MAHPNIRVEAFSRIYETEPQEISDQPWFLNAIVQIDTGLPPRKLLAFLKTMEAEIGREITYRFGPRVLDMDILTFEGVEIQEEGLQIPHPRMHQRAFVLVPLSELEPDLRLSDGTTAREGAARTAATQKVNLYGTFRVSG